MYKARFAVTGFNQQLGFDFTKSFSPIVKPISIRIVLTLALTCNWSIFHLDVHNVFLNGFLDEEVYIAQPPRFEGTDTFSCLQALHGHLWSKISSLCLL